jgi:catechol 2,3-dioxygenase-like lactoylglutathione lyase family enzyme/glycerol uptake facilitator-like aquaporin
MEALGLGLFMLSAAAFATLLFHPDSPLATRVTSPLTRRLLMGAAMGLTAIGLVYSPWGRRSGAHLNPAVTLAFFRLGKIERGDAVWYALSQAAGGIAGMLVAVAVLGDRVAHDAVNYVVTVPGASGVAAAFAAELAISGGLMLVVLTTSSSGRLAPFTGLLAGVTVATWIGLEAPLSGMSMNPARTLASAVAGWTWTAFWIYLVAPPLGMLLAAEIHVRVARRAIACAKLYHDTRSRCIFRCGRGAVTPTGERAMPRPVPVRVFLVLIALAAMAVFGASGHGAPSPTPVDEPLVRAGHAVGITVSDLERAVDFYTRVLFFEQVGDVEIRGEDHARLFGVADSAQRTARLRLGDEHIELTEYAPRGRPVPGDSRSNDRWFQHIAIIVNDLDQAYLWLRRHGVEHVSPEPQRLPDWNPTAAGIRAFYFKDPDGHALEILEFPPDKGDARWHRPGDRVFLGIDHTAIVVRDTDTSLRFYRDILGLRVAGRSENWGPEQERLNNVPGARLRITTLRAPRGPGIELLEYIAPRDGRPAPADTRANDLAHWYTVLEIASAEKGLPVLRANGSAAFSSVITRVPEAPRGAFLARDPDGHALLFRGAER